MPFITIVFLTISGLYLLRYVENFSAVWFNPLFTNDDAQQQIFPLHKVLDPELFQNDIITRVMEGYLPPLHFALSAFFTWATGDPVLAGHWIMAIQFILCVVFLFLAAKSISSTAPACISVCWFMLSQVLWSRLMGGLPRGWAAFIITAFFYFALTRRHLAVVVLLFVGLLLNPPAAFLCGACYGLTIGVGFLQPSTRAQNTRPMAMLLLAVPLLALLSWQVVKRPGYIGHMATLAEASRMEAFERPGGRFAFLPFRPPFAEINQIGARAFVLNGRFVPDAIRQNMILLPTALLLALYLLQVRLRLEVIPSFFPFFIAGALIVYFLSREFAFRLYVPDRHLLLPLNMAWITLFPAAIWRAFHRGASRESTVFSDATIRSAGWSALGVAVFAAGIVAINGIGARTVPGLHLRTDLRQASYTWIEQHAGKNEIIASHPARIDGVQLFAKRIAYVTSETAHPFYPIFYREMERRIRISLRSYYTTDSWAKFYEKLKTEPIKYFVFVKGDFTPETLTRARYSKPFHREMKRLTKKEVSRYLGSKLSDPLRPRFPFIVYEDHETAIVDVPALAQQLLATPNI